MAHSKIVLATGEVLIDLTQDTVAASNLLKGTTAHGADGEPVIGTCTFDVDSSAASAKPAEVLNGKTYGAGGKMNTGTMPNNGASVLKITKKADKVVIPVGYHDGSGYAQIDSNEQAKIIPGNIRQGVTLLGVAGEMTGSEGIIAQEKTVTPSFADQSVLPDSGYTHLSEVLVKAIKVTYAANSAGGTTVTIG